jgi:maltose O-acetyltransferase
MAYLISCMRKLFNFFYFLFISWKTEFLVNRGLKLGKNVFIDINVFIDPNVPWLISIGDECTLTKGVKILAHDASIKRHLNYTKVGRVSIGRRTFIGFDSIILPGVKIGENVIIGAGSVVTKDIPDNSIVIGNPAVVICSLQEYLEKHRKNMNCRPVYGNSWTLESGITNEKKEKMKAELEDRIGYII